jgi:hypothetical protein
MNKLNSKPILVTGTHRSGTTWVGKMIASSPRVGYIWEPFNPNHKKGVFAKDVEQFYTFVDDTNSNLYDQALNDTLNFKYSLTSQARCVRNLRGIGEMLLAYQRTRLFRIERRRALMKDPNALLAAEWIASRFGAQVIVLVRHPAAFVNSLIKASWNHPFEDFLEQPNLISGPLAPFKEDFLRAVEKPIGILDQGILLWRALHHTISQYRRKHPDWLFVRHEDLSMHPIDAFDPVFKFLRLEYSPEVRKTIEAATRVGNPAERPGEVWPPFAKLDSRLNVKRWADRLTAGQIEHIQERAEDVWREFYNDEDWRSERTSLASTEIVERVTR